MERSDVEFQFSVVPLLKLVARELTYEANEVHISVRGEEKKGGSGVDGCGRMGSNRDKRMNASDLRA